jgi:uracil-DNA glycosylase family 4
MSKTPFIDPFSAAIAALEDYVAFEVEEGRNTVAMDPAVIADLATPPPSASSSAPPAAAAAVAPPAALASTPLDDVAQEIAACTQCALHATRTNTVPGEGAPQPEVMFVVEAPGADEDAQGRPFVGRAGKLLTKMIRAMGFQREEVFIANICKCRPPENRKPEPAEMEACMPYLKRQIALLTPRVIVCLGASATESLLGLTGISRVRGTWHTFEGIDVMPTFHPSYLLRKPGAKHDTWADLKAVLERIGRPVPPVGAK